MTAATSDHAAIRQWLASDEFTAEPVVDVTGSPLVLDLGRGSDQLGEAADATDAIRFGALIDAAVRRAGRSYAVGRWAEDRALYTTEHFAGEGGERRTVHLGVDVFRPAGTRVFAPLDALVEIVANNARELDYGPLVILQHTTPAGRRFWTLYGHLGPDCLSTLRAGMPVGPGEAIGTIGAPPGNGNWPPHLHFQVILDLKGLGREFPGVARASEARHWLALSPNPAAFFPQLTVTDLDGRPRQR